MEENTRNYISLNDALRVFEPLSLGLMVKPVGASCPLACNYCYYREAPRGVMSRSLLEKTVREAVSVNDGPEVVFNWHGGEPLLAGLDFFREAVRLQKQFASGKTVTNTLQTGGTLLTPEWAAFFRDEDFLVGLSLDGPQGIHDAFRRDASGAASFEQVLHGIALLAGCGVRFNTLTTVKKASRGHGAEVYRFLKSAGSRYLQFLPVADPGRAENETRARATRGLPRDSCVTPRSLRLLPPRGATGPRLLARFPK